MLRSRSWHPALSLLTLLIAAAICSPLYAQRASTQRTSATPTVVTRDLGNFYKAFDAARGRDSVERVRAFRELYLAPASPGLADWAVLRLSNFESIVPKLVEKGWAAERIEDVYGAPSTDTVRQRLMRDAMPLVYDDAAVRLAALTARMPRFFDGIRSRVMMLDTSTAFRKRTATGLARLQQLVPDRTLPPVYLLIGRLTSGGTASRNGMLIGAELSSRLPSTPVDELTETQRNMVSERTPAGLTTLIVHEAVHTMQTGHGNQSLEAHVIKEGVADFLAHLALDGHEVLDAGYQKYGRAHEPELKTAFREAIARKDAPDRWLYSWGRTDNYGAPDLGYFIGFRICEAYYRQAKDKRAAIADMLDGTKASMVLAKSGYLAP